MDPPLEVEDNVRGSDSPEEVVEDGKNKYSIICIRCPSVILNPGLGLYVSDKEFDLPQMTQKRDAPKIEKDKIAQYFRVKDKFDFENIGFSNRQEDVVYLACADCEFGPVGFSADNVSYVAIPRVRFKFLDEGKTQT